VQSASSSIPLNFPPPLCVDVGLINGQNIDAQNHPISPNIHHSNQWMIAILTNRQVKRQGDILHFSTYVLSNKHMIINHRYRHQDHNNDSSL
jgi:hypothetical protein